MRLTTYLCTIVALSGLAIAAPAGTTQLPVAESAASAAEATHKPSDSADPGQSFFAPSTLQALSIITTIALAFIGYVVTSTNGLRLEKRKGRLDLVSRQLQHLYGPLYSLNSASTTAWSGFRARCRPGIPFLMPNPPPTAKELEEWRLWITTVFDPINRTMELAIIENAHLIEGDKMPGAFIDFLAHVEGYKVVISKWKAGDFSEHTSLLNFPKQFGDHVNEMFFKLKARQADLVGLTITKNPSGEPISRFARKARLNSQTSKVA